jgi:GT2 family glycosyltransferase
MFEWLKWKSFERFQSETSGIRASIDKDFSPLAGNLSALVELTVIVPSYNQCAYLEDTLQSIIAQRDSRIQIYVVDGGSTDGSVSVIKKYERHISWWVSEPDGGQANALNKALSRCSTKYFAWQNSDDVYTPGALTQMLDAANQHSNASIVYGNLLIADQDLRIFADFRFNRYKFSLLPYRALAIANQACIMRTDIVHAVGGFDDDLRYCLDLDLWLRLRRERVVFVNRYLGVYRVHSLSKTEQLESVHRVERKKLINNFCPNSYRRLMLCWVLIFDLACFILSGNGMSEVRRRLAVLLGDGAWKPPLS